MRDKKIVLTTWGSFGDLHPYIAIALELKRRGARPMIATSRYYQAKIEAEGIDFHLVRPDLPPPEDAPELVRQTLKGRAGARYLFENLLMPHLRETYADIEAATCDADMLVTHPLSYAGVLLAEKTGIAWASSVLAPISLFSAHDPPRIDEAGQIGARQLNRLVKLHPAITRLAFALGKRSVRSWVREIAVFRCQLGLPPGAHPMFEGQHSPRLVLALFSEIFASVQPDFPARTHLTGFPFYDQRDHAGSTQFSDGLQKFLDAGESPIVFTLGSSAVWVADDFYQISLDAVKRLKRRAVLLIGDERNLPVESLPPEIIAVGYAPFSELLPRSLAVVHSGGIGSTAQCLRAGVPSLIVPFAYDQFDNAARTVRIGCGRTVAKRDYTSARVAAELHELTQTETYRTRAREIGRRIRAENGAARACDLLERMKEQESVAGSQEPE